MTRYAVHSRPVRFRFDGGLAAACLYLPRLAGPQPGLLFIHADLTPDGQAQGMAERLAHVGYVTLAVDALEGELERAEALLCAALAWLRGIPSVKDGIAGAFGIGRGGDFALWLAMGPGPVEAAVSIDGDCDIAPAHAAAARAPLLVIAAGPRETSGPAHGAQGGAMPAAAAYPHQFVRYPLAARGFFDERGPAFRPDDAEDAWSRANKFFYQHLGEPG